MDLSDNAICSKCGQEKEFSLAQYEDIQLYKDRANRP
jgi:hypothetical protein